MLIAVNVIYGFADLLEMLFNSEDSRSNSKKTFSCSLFDFRNSIKIYTKIIKFIEINNVLCFEIFKCLYSF